MSGVIRIGEMVRRTVKEALNAMLDAKADRLIPREHYLCGRQRWHRRHSSGLVHATRLKNVAAREDGSGGRRRSTAASHI